MEEGRNRKQKKNNLALRKFTWLSNSRLSIVFKSFFFFLPSYSCGACKRCWPRCSSRCSSKPRLAACSLRRFEVGAHHPWWIRQQRYTDLNYRGGIPLIGNGKPVPNRVEMNIVSLCWIPDKLTEWRKNGKSNKNHDKNKQFLIPRVYSNARWSNCKQARFPRWCLMPIAQSLVK